MQDLIDILNNNGIKYFSSCYAGYESIIIKKNNYKIEIYYHNGFVSDLQKIPYTWGIMGSTSIDEIINDLKNYLKIEINIYQLSLI